MFFRDYSTNHSVRDVVSFNLRDYLSEFQLFGEPHVDRKEGGIKEIEKMKREALCIEHLDYGFDCNNGRKDRGNCDDLLLGMPITLPTLSWDQEYRLEEKPEEDNNLVDEIHDKLDACLDEYNYVKDDDYCIAHPRNIKKYLEEDENLDNDIEDLMISEQEAVIDNTNAEMYDEISDDVMIDDDVFYFEESSPSNEDSTDYDGRSQCQVIEILPDPLIPDDPELYDGKTFVEIDEQKHIVEDQPYSTVEDFINQFGSYLPGWELKEVLNYNKIYYPGSVSIYQNHTENFEASTDYGNGTYKMVRRCMQYTFL